MICDDVINRVVMECGEERFVCRLFTLTNVYDVYEFFCIVFEASLTSFLYELGEGAIILTLRVRVRVVIYFVTM